MPTMPLDPAQLADQLFPDLVAVAQGTAPYPDIADPNGRRLVAGNVLTMLQLQQTYQLTLATREVAELLEEQNQEAKRSRGLLRGIRKDLHVVAELLDGAELEDVDDDPTAEPTAAPLRVVPTTVEKSAPALSEPELLDGSQT